MDPRISDLRRRVARAGAARLEDIDEIDDMLEAEGPSVELLILRGQLIQLVTDGDHDALEEAFACYQEALELDPDSAVAHEEIGHFLDDVADEPGEAVPFFRRAIALGAGPSAEEGLRDVLSQLGGEDGEPV
jgi:tetratricopeptide (TPR) repeat protein